MRFPPRRRLSAAASATGEAATSQTDYRDKNPAVAAGNEANPKSQIRNHKWRNSKPWFSDFGASNFKSIWSFEIRISHVSG
jgi:hypothetical protein